MDGIQTIRSLFPDGIVSADDKGFSVNYTQKEWVHQSWEDGRLDDLRSLIATVEGFSIIINRGKTIKLQFLIDGVFDQSQVHPAKNDGEGSNAEIFRAVSQDDEWELHPAALEVLHAADRELLHTNEEYAIDVGFAMLDAVLEARRTNVYDYQKVSAWPRIRALFSMLVRDGFFCETEVTPQEPGIHYGGVTFYLDPNDGAHWPDIIKGDTKAHFTELLSLVSEFEIDFNIKEGFVNLEFYA